MKISWPKGDLWLQRVWSQSVKSKNRGKRLRYHTFSTLGKLKGAIKRFPDKQLFPLSRKLMGLSAFYLALHFCDRVSGLYKAKHHEFSINFNRVFRKNCFWKTYKELKLFLHKKFWSDVDQSLIRFQISPLTMKSVVVGRVRSLSDRPSHNYKIIDCLHRSI